MAVESQARGLRLPALGDGGGGAPGASLRIFRVGGIDVSVHVSWLLVFALVTWSLATGFFPQALPGLDARSYVFVGAVAALLLFVSVLIHELAHSFTAKAKGLEARSITLFIFGGVSNLGGEAKQPSTEFLVAVVGPLTSFAIALVTFLVGSASAPGSIVAAVAAYLTVINLLLGVFNLIPGFPLDGGRVFRSIVWNATGSLRRGTEVAVVVSRFIAYGFLVWGFLRLLSGDLIGGLWIAAIGWFLENAAGAS
ncbi:MAG: site-2 protease family protein, partial [Chloroflexota bacterium]|nr:site-2 protease family protein [Chloroflexota bacterium]